MNIDDIKLDNSIINNNKMFELFTFNSDMSINNVCYYLNNNYVEHLEITRLSIYEDEQIEQLLKSINNIIKLTIYKVNFRYSTYIKLLNYLANNTKIIYLDFHSIELIRLWNDIFTIDDVNKSYRNFIENNYTITKFYHYPNYEISNLISERNIKINNIISQFDNCYNIDDYVNKKNEEIELVIKEFLQKLN